jgi:hypothetical protein
MPTRERHQSEAAPCFALTGGYVKNLLNAVLRAVLKLPAGTSAEVVNEPPKKDTLTLDNVPTGRKTKDRYVSKSKRQSSIKFIGTKKRSKR